MEITLEIPDNTICGTVSLVVASNDHSGMSLVSHNIDTNELKSGYAQIKI